MDVRHYGKFISPLEVPPLTDIQTRSYAEFLQEEVPFNRRTDSGLEAILRAVEDAPVGRHAAADGHDEAIAFKPVGAIGGSATDAFDVGGGAGGSVRIEFCVHAATLDRFARSRNHRAFWGSIDDRAARLAMNRRPR